MEEKEKDVIENNENKNEEPSLPFVVCAMTPSSIGGKFSKVVQNE